MKKTTVLAPSAPKAIGPYSQAVWAGDLLFCSGQIGLDPSVGSMVSGGIAEQTARVLDNLGAVLRSQGLDYHNIVKTTVFLADMHQFAAMNEVYALYFPTDPPARATVEAARLPKDALVEIEAIACR